MLIDTHAHYSHHKFEQSFRYLAYSPAAGEVSLAEGDRQALKTGGIGAVVEPGIGFESNERILALAEACPGWLYPGVGRAPDPHSRGAMEGPQGPFRNGGAA